MHKEKHNKRGWGRPLMRVWYWIPVLLTILLILSLVAPFYVYSRFNQQQPVARLEFEALADNWYLASVTRFPECTTASYRIHGDQWQLDAAFVKWKGIAVLLGAESRVVLDRLSGRFRQIAQVNNQAPTLYDLKPNTWFDLSTPVVDGSNSLFVDSYFGSSVYLDIQTDKSFWVYKTEDGLISKGRPRTLITQENGVITLVIEQGCGNADPSFVEVMARRWNEQLIRIKAWGLTVFKLV